MFALFLNYSNFVHSSILYIFVKVRVMYLIRAADNEADAGAVISDAGNTGNPGDDGSQGGTVGHPGGSGGAYIGVVAVASRSCVSHA